MNRLKSFFNGRTGKLANRQTGKPKNMDRKINLGRQNPEVFEVLAGLQPGEKVITSSYDNYGDHIDKLVLK